LILTYFRKPITAAVTNQASSPSLAEFGPAISFAPTLQSEKSTRNLLREKHLRSRLSSKRHRHSIKGEVSKKSDGCLDLDEWHDLRFIAIKSELFCNEFSKENKDWPVMPG